MVIKLKKINQLNLTSLNETLIRKGFSCSLTMPFIIDNKFIFYNDFDSLEKCHFVVIDKGKIKKIEIDSLLIRNQENKLYETDQVNFVCHKDNLLAFVTERKKVEGLGCTVNQLKHILVFNPKELSYPKVIQLTNTIKPSTKQERGGECYTVATINEVYQSDSDEFPAIMTYGNGELNIDIIKINFNELSAKWLFTKHKNFIRLPLSDICTFINWQEGLEPVESHNIHSYTTSGAESESIFDRLLMKDSKILFFTLGTRRNFRKYGMYRYIFLGELQHDNNQKYKLSKIHKEAFFDGKNYEWELGIMFGREAVFTSSHKHIIINPVYKSSDPWGYREKIYDFETEILYDVIFPRGFKKHGIFDIKDNKLISIGENSKSETLITIFDID